MPRGKEKSEGPGPQPDRLKIEGDWEDAVKQAIETPPPEKPEGDEPEGEKKP